MSAETSSRKKGDANAQFTLPEGWVVETRVRKAGKQAGHTYKCYYDPVTKVRFYSLKDVIRHLYGIGENTQDHIREANYLPENSSSEKMDKNVISPSDVRIHIESSPVGLPTGWIKEIRYRKNGSRLRKDAHYIDPESRYLFRSKKDALHYVETGEVRKNVSKQKVNGNITTQTSGFPLYQGGPCLYVEPISCSFRSFEEMRKRGKESFASPFSKPPDCYKMDSQDISCAPEFKCPDLTQKPNLSSGCPIELNLHVSEAQGSLQVNSGVGNPFPRRRFKKMAIRRPFRKKEVEERLPSEEPQTPVDMDTSDGESLPNSSSTSSVKEATETNDHLQQTTSVETKTEGI